MIVIVIVIMIVIVIVIMMIVMIMIMIMIIVWLFNLFTFLCVSYLGGYTHKTRKYFMYFFKYNIFTLKLTLFHFLTW